MVKRIRPLMFLFVIWSKIQLCNISNSPPEVGFDVARVRELGDHAHWAQVVTKFEERKYHSVFRLSHLILLKLFSLCLRALIEVRMSSN